MKAKTRQYLLRRPVVVCTSAFILAAILHTLNGIFGGGTAIARLLDTSGQWFDLALQGGIILFSGALAAWVISELEHERRQWEQQYATIIEKAHEGIAIVQDKRVVFANPRALAISGLSAEEAKGYPFINIISPEYREVVADRYDRRLSGGDVPERYELEVTAKDGRRVPIEVSANAVERDGKLADVVIIRDMTARKSAEQAILLERDKARQLIDIAGVMVLALDSEGKVTLINAKGCEILDCRVSDVVGKRFADTFLPERTRAKVKAAFARLMAGAMEPVEYAEDPILTSHGTERTIAWHNAVIKDEKGDIIGTLSSGEDITARKKTEEALRLERENFRNSLETSPLGIQIVTHRDGEVVYANRALLDIWGYDSLKELQSTSLEQRFAPSSSTWIRELRQRHARGEFVGQYEHEAVAVRKDGQLRHLLVRRTQIIWDGRACAQVVYEDITERRQAEAALQVERENFKNSTEMSPLGIQVITAEGALVYTNRTMLDMWGYGTLEELKAKPLEQRFTPATVALIREMNERRKHGQLAPSREMTIVCKNGATRDVRAHDKEVIWNGERLIQVLYEDISERKQAEAALRVERQNFQNSTEMSPLGIQVITLEGDLVYVNRTMLDMWGYGTLEELKRVPKERRFTPETTALIGEINEMRRQGKAPAQHEVTMICRDGRRRILRAYNKDMSWNGKRCAEILYEDITERKKAEEKILESERRYRLLAENIADVIWVADLTSPDRLSYISPSIDALLGYSSDEAIAQPIDKVFSPESLEATRRVLGQELSLLSAGQKDLAKTRVLQLEMIHKNGSVVPVEIKFSYVPSSDGNPGEILAVARDISERKQAEALYRTMADGSPVGVYIIQDNEFVFTNPAFTIATGFAKAELVNKSPLELAHPDDMKRVRESAVAMLRGETAQPYEFRFVTRNGQVRWAVERVSSVTYRGRRATLGSFLDVTEIKEADAKIERAAQEWRTTFDSMTDLISIHDKDNRLMRVNKAFANAVGASPRDLIGKKCQEVMHGLSDPPQNCAFVHARETGTPSVMQVFNAERGTWIEESMSPMVDGSGEVVGTISIMKDITESKQMQQQLIMTDRLASIGELVSGIAHELNNPLTGVIGFSQLILEKDVPQDIKEDLTIVSNEAQRAARIVKNLLTFARKHAPVKQPTQLNSIVEDVLRLRAYEHKVNNIEVITHLDPDLPEIMADYFQIQQVLLNIIINAEFFMVEAHKRGTLAITTERTGGFVRASFTDDGPGIPPENLGRIFNPFFTTKEVGKGTGLGLSICHGIVTEHSGRIYARSEQGKGATFVVELPLDEPVRPSSGKGLDYAPANSAYRG